VSDDAWFTRILALPDAAQFPAIVSRLARLDADGATALWEAWRGFVAETPGLAENAGTQTFATHLRRGVERAVSAGYRHVA